MSLPVELAVNKLPEGIQIIEDIQGLKSREQFRTHEDIALQRFIFMFIQLLEWVSDVNGQLHISSPGRE